ncbi:MAG: MBL fold metallo-hydrolase [Anaerolineae bacterium]|nr:MBL fold metallo-hydrolase [Anaerolineae bacterium]
MKKSIQSFGETANIAVTVLVDNRADLMTKSTDTVKRFTDAPLLAEHGFSAWVDLKDAGIRILWDAGITTTALMENVRRMKVDLGTIDKIALSHGHGDHTAAMTEILKAMDVFPQPRKWAADVPVAELRRYAQGRRIPLIAHPAAFREQWHIDPDSGEKYGPYFGPPRAEWEAYGAEVILSEDPTQLGPGCWTTGYVPRESFESSGIPKSLYYREGDTFIPAAIEDDQAIVINVQNKGLVILSGCAHSGIVNTINYAKTISGVDKVWAVLGGFHLASSSDEDIQRTIDEIRSLDLTLVSPSHCTGFKAICQFAVQMPDQFVLGLVGTTFLF